MLTSVKYKPLLPFFVKEQERVAISGSSKFLTRNYA